MTTVIRMLNIQNGDQYGNGNYCFDDNSKY